MPAGIGPPVCRRVGPDPGSPMRASCVHGPPSGGTVEPSRETFPPTPRASHSIGSPQRIESLPASVCSQTGAVARPLGDGGQRPDEAADRVLPAPRVLVPSSVCGAVRKATAVACGRAVIAATSSAATSASASEWTTSVGVVVSCQVVVVTGADAPARRDSTGVVATRAATVPTKAGRRAPRTAPRSADATSSSGETAAIPSTSTRPAATEQARAQADHPCSTTRRAPRARAARTAATMRSAAPG